MKYMDQVRLDENPIIFENFQPSSVAVGNVDVEITNNENSVFVNPTMAGGNVMNVKYNNPSATFTITGNANSQRFMQLIKAVNDYIKESKSRGSARSLGVALELKAFNLKITSRDAVWERPLFSGSIYDPSTTMPLKLILGNAIIEDLT